MHKVDGWGFLKHYGTDRLVISLEVKVYQAGENLEENVKQLKDLCMIKVDKVRTNTNTKQNMQYVLCMRKEIGRTMNSKNSGFVCSPIFSISSLFSRSTPLWGVSGASVCLYLTRFLLAVKSHVTRFLVSDSLDTNLILDN